MLSLTSMTEAQSLTIIRSDVWRGSSIIICIWSRYKDISVCKENYSATEIVL